MKPKHILGNTLKPIDRATGIQHTTLKVNGPVASTLHTLLQWEAKLPSAREGDKRITIDDLLGSGGGSDSEQVEFQTDDKMCVALYVPTGSTVDSYRLLKNGKVLEITIFTHKLMWDPKAIHLTTEQTQVIQEPFDSIRMKARKRILSEAIKQNLMKGSRIQRMHKFEVPLKKPVSDDENDTSHYCYTFECSANNHEQLYMAYFEMSVLKPKMIKTSPKRIESKVERLNTGNNSQNNPPNNNGNQTTPNQNNPAGSSQNSSRSSYDSSRSSYNNNLGHGTQTNAAATTEEIKKLTNENNTLKQSMKDFVEAANKKIHSANRYAREKERSSEQYKREIEKALQDQRKEEMRVVSERHNLLKLQMEEEMKKQQRELVAQREQEKDHQEQMMNRILQQREAELFERMQKQMHEEVKNQQEGLKYELSQAQNERNCAEKGLIEQKTKASKLEEERFVLTDTINGLKGDIEKKTRQAETNALALTTPPVNSTFLFDSRESSGKKRKGQDLDILSPQSAVVEQE